LNNKFATIVGVASNDFSGLDLSRADVWVPMTQQPYFVDGSKLLTDFSDESGVDMWGRMQPGITPKVAEAEVRLLLAQLFKQHPAELWENETLHADPAGHARIEHGRSKGDSAPPSPWSELYPIIALVSAFVLLILGVSCGNLGSLLLARGVSREREISIRISVGAGRVRLIRQLFTESLLLAFAGSMAGLVLGFITLRVLIRWLDSPTWLDATPDWRVVLFSLAIGMVAAMLFGLTPALQVARQRHRATMMRQWLIGAQVAASCVLLIVSGLLVRAADYAVHFNPGFEYEKVALIEPDLGSHGYSPEKARAYFDEWQRRLLQLPGVQSVALTSIPPLGGTVETTGTEMGGHQVSIHASRVSPEFFQTMGIPILRGRAFRAGETHALVVGESFARAGWPGKDALGAKFTTGSTDSIVVGIAGTARLVKREDPDAVEAYFPLETSDLTGASLLVKTSVPTESVLPAINSIARSIRPDIPPFVQLLKTSFRRRLGDIENTTLAVGTLGGVALAIACLGIVGLVAYSVSQRTREIGLRMALGAQGTDVLFVVLQQFSRTVLFGLLGGVLGAAALSQLLRHQLYGISNLDPISYFSAPALFILVAVIAALLPARRALRIDPMLALRHD
jgi:predicted permease